MIDKNHICYNCWASYGVCPLERKVRSLDKIQECLNECPCLQCIIKSICSDLCNDRINYAIGIYNQLHYSK